MVQRLGFSLAFAAALALTPATCVRADPVTYGQPAVNTPLVGCVEGRAVRIVNGVPSCASTSAPTLTACTGGTIDAQATDFIGQVTLPAGLTSCTIVMTKLYATTFVCLVQAQSGSTLTIASPTVGATATNSTIAVPFGVSAAGAKFGYICGPG